MDQWITLEMIKSWFDMIPAWLALPGLAFILIALPVGLWSFDHIIEMASKFLHPAEAGENDRL